MSSSNGSGLCGAMARSTGNPCTQPAGWGTDHVGEGRCRFHGGASPIKHGRYSKVKREPIRRLIESYQDDPDPLNLLPELAAMRALFTDFIERYDEWREAFLAWHTSFGSENGNPKPKQVLDLADATKILDRIGRMVERIEKVRAQNAISAPELFRVMSEIKRVIELEVENPRTRERIADQIGSIRVKPNE